MNTKKILLSFIFLIFCLLFFPRSVFATPVPGASVEDVIDSFKFEASSESGLLDNTDMHLHVAETSGNPEQRFWNRIFTEYKGLIIGISGISLLTFVLMFIFAFMKLSTTAANPQARKNVQAGLLWTGIGAVISGATLTLVSFGFNLFK